MPLVDYVMAPVGTSASYREKLVGSFTGGGYTFGLRDSTTRLTGLTVRVNDSTFASVTNGVSPYAPDITRADGKPTTAAQSAAVMDR